MSSSEQVLRRRLGDLLRRRPWLTGAVVVIVLGAVVVLAWFQPQTLLFDQVVAEEFPMAEPMDSEDAEMADSEMADSEDMESEDMESEETGSGPMDSEDMDEDEMAAESMGPVKLTTGSFDSRGRYTVTGTATIYENEDGSRFLRLEDFETTNGPDLFVYLTVAGSADDDEALDEEFVNLGVLKGNIGNQNYDIDDDIDLDRYDTVVIWCRRFTVGFGAADLVSQM